MLKIKYNFVLIRAQWTVFIHLKMAWFFYRFGKHSNIIVLFDTVIFRLKNVAYSQNLNVWFHFIAKKKIDFTKLFWTKTRLILHIFYHKIQEENIHSTAHNSIRRRTSTNGHVTRRSTIHLKPFVLLNTWPTSLWMKPVKLTLRTCLFAVSNILRIILCSVMRLCTLVGQVSLNRYTPSEIIPSTIELKVKPIKAMIKHSKFFNWR